MASNLIVGHVDRRGGQSFMKLLELHPGLNPKLGVQVGQGFVKKKNSRFSDNGPAHGHPLALTAGKLFRLSLQQLLDTQDFRGFPDPLLDVFLGKLLHLQGEGHVLEYAHMRIQGVILKDHGDVSVLGGQFIDHLVLDDNIAAGDRLQSGDHAQRGCFAAAAGTDENHKFLVLDGEVENR